MFAIIYKKPSRQFNANKDVEEIEYKQVEKGVRTINPRPNRHGGTDGDCYFFQLNEMTDEAIMRYGLRDVKERYKRGEAHD